MIHTYDAIAAVKVRGSASLSTRMNAQARSIAMPDPRNEWRGVREYSANGRGNGRYPECSVSSAIGSWQYLQPIPRYAASREGEFGAVDILVANARLVDGQH